MNVVTGRNHPIRPFQGLAFSALLFSVGCTTPDFDIVISGGTVYDGSGGTPFVADVGISEGRIREIGDLAGRSSEETVDATGLIVTPGFIDAHSHAEMDEA